LIIYTIKITKSIKTRRKIKFFLRLSFVFILTLSLVLPLSTSVTAQQNKNRENQFFFFLLSDTQLGMMSNNNGFDKEVQNFEKVIAAANRLRPAFLVVCGDLVNQAGNQRQISAYKHVAAKLDPSIPIYNLPGNHDVNNIPTAKALATYRSNFGPDYYSFRHDNLYGIVLNSSIFFNPSKISNELAIQDEWLRTQLIKANKSGYTHIVLFQHIAWFIHKIDEKNQYFNIPTERRKKYMKLFNQYEVSYIFAGHLHQNAIGQDKDLKIITTSAVGMPLGADSSGFRIVKVNGNDISYPYYSLDSIPDKITF